MKNLRFKYRLTLLMSQNQKTLQKKVEDLLGEGQWEEARNIIYKNPNIRLERPVNPYSRNQETLQKKLEDLFKEGKWQEARSFIYENPNIKLKPLLNPYDEKSYPMNDNGFPIEPFNRNGRPMVFNKASPELRDKINNLMDHQDWNGVYKLLRANQWVDWDTAYDISTALTPYMRFMFEFNIYDEKGFREYFRQYQDSHPITYKANSSDGFGIRERNIYYTKKPGGLLLLQEEDRLRPVYRKEMKALFEKIFRELTRSYPNPFLYIHWTGRMSVSQNMLLLAKRFIRIPGDYEEYTEKLRAALNYETYYLYKLYNNYKKQDRNPSNPIAISLKNKNNKKNCSEPGCTIMGGSKKTRKAKRGTKKTLRRRKH